MKKNGRCRKAEQLAEVCAANPLRRQDQKARAASCRSYGKQLLAETTGFAEPPENKRTVVFFSLGLLFSGYYYRWHPT